MDGLLSHNAMSCSVGSIEIVLRRVVLLLHSSCSLALTHALPLALGTCPLLLVVAFVAGQWSGRRGGGGFKPPQLFNLCSSMVWLGSAHWRSRFARHMAKRQQSSQSFAMPISLK